MTGCDLNLIFGVWPLVSIPLIKGSSALPFRARTGAEAESARPLPLRAELEVRFGADLEVGNEEVD